MKKGKLLALLLAGLMSASVLFACGDGGNGDGSGSGNGGANTEQGGGASSEQSGTVNPALIQGTYKFESLMESGVKYNLGDDIGDMTITEDFWMLGLDLDGTGYLSMAGNPTTVTWQEVDGIYVVNMGDGQTISFTKDGLRLTYSIDKDNSMTLVKKSDSVNPYEFGLGDTGSPDGDKPSGGVVKPEGGDDSGEEGKPDDGAGNTPVKAYMRIDAEGKESDTGEYVLFGSYPQSRVSNATIVEELNAQAGDLPTETDAGDWTDYGYYSGGQVESYMWYIDVETNGEKYRGVYFDEYRPWLTSDTPTTDNTHQIENGYVKETVYWFAYEPIEWRILKESNGEATLLCEMIIDAQAYQNVAMQGSGGEYYQEENKYANNYQYSTIRSWLNDTFYNTAFASLEKAIIVTTAVDNGKSTTHNKDSNGYACANTNDNVWLMSYQETLNTDYGFSKNTSSNAMRSKKGTAYAICQGAQRFPDSGSSYACGAWMLRSPYASSSQYNSYVMSNGTLMTWTQVNKQMMGVVPALKIQL